MQAQRLQSPRDSHPAKPANKQGGSPGLALSLHLRRGVTRSAPLLLFFCTVASPAPPIVAGPTTYLQSLATAGPGSVIKLKPGLYYGGLRIAGLSVRPMSLSLLRPQILGTLPDLLLVPAGTQ